MWNEAISVSFQPAPMMRVSSNHPWPRCDSGDESHDSCLKKGSLSVVLSLAPSEPPNECDEGKNAALTAKTTPESNSCEPTSEQVRYYQHIEYRSKLEHPGPILT